MTASLDMHRKVFCCVTHNITYFRIEEAHQCRSKFNHVESCHHHVETLFLYIIKMKALNQGEKLRNDCVEFEKK